MENLNGKNAVFAVDVGLNILSEVVGNMEVEGNGNAFIIEGNTGTMLAHKDTSLIGSKMEGLSDSFYKNVYNDILTGSFTTGSYDSEDGKYMVSVQ